MFLGPLPARGLSWFVFALVAGLPHQGLAQWMTQTNVTFTLPNSVLGAYSVEDTTNLTDWYPLYPTTLRYLFTDTNAPAVPQRSYRLVYP